MRVRGLLVAPVRALQIDRYGARPLPDGTFDAIVVPGCLVYRDGRPSPALVRRVDHGVRLFEDGRAPLLAFSGRGRGGRPEAEVMRELALDAGVPDASIVIEAASMTTAENARMTHGVLGGGRIVVATDTTHVLRCEREFGRWFDEVVGTGTPLSRRSRVRAALREALREAVLAW